MTKKEIVLARKPTARQVDPEDADAWVKNRKLPTDKEELPAPEQVDKTVYCRMTFDLSRELHRRFRTTCSQMDVNMTDELRAFVIRFLARHEKQ